MSKDDLVFKMNCSSTRDVWCNDMKLLKHEDTPKEVKVIDEVTIEVQVEFKVPASDVFESKTSPIINMWCFDELTKHLSAFSMYKRRKFISSSRTIFLQFRNLQNSRMSFAIPGANDEEPK